MRRLGDLEADVMNVVWDRHDDGVSVRDVVGELERTRTIAYTTVLTVMNNLVRKGVLVRDESERAHRFQPAVSRAEFAAALMAEVLAGTPDKTAVLLQFAQQLDDQEITSLASAARRRRRPRA